MKFVWGMDVGAPSLIPGLPDFVIASIVLPKLESSKVKSELLQTFGSLVILNRTWSAFIHTREKYLEAYEEWWEQERRWALQNFYDTMPEEAFSD